MPVSAPATKPSPCKFRELSIEHYSTVKETLKGWIASMQSFPASFPRHNHRHRIAALLVGVAQHDAASEFLDADLVLQQPLHQFLEQRDRWGNDLEQVIVATTDVVALDDFLILGRALFELAEISRAVAAERDFGKHHDMAAQLV